MKKLKPKQKARLAARKCDHYNAYFCSRCKQCYVCRHRLIELPEPAQGCEFWWACPDGFKKPSYLDFNTFNDYKINDSTGINFDKDLPDGFATA